MKILIVDENTADRALLKHHLKKPNQTLEIVEIEDAQEVLSYIEESSDIDCALIDYNLPGMNGLELLKSIYDKDIQAAPFPVIIVTSSLDEAIFQKLLEYGAQDYMLKSHISADTIHIAIGKSQHRYKILKSSFETKKMLAHSQKMEAIGRLTGGIAHDFNNLLTISFGNIRLLEDMVKRDNLDPEKILQKLQSIKKASERGANLVKRLMVFSRQRKLEPQTINVNDLIADLQELMQRSIGEAIEVKIELDKKIPSVDVDPNQLENALINMTVNAKDAIIDSGTVTIKTSTKTLYEEEAKTLKVAPGIYLMIEVSDDGTGIGPEDLENIFEPFFTTKSEGHGTGLGLSMVYSFVKDSKGAISVKSEKGAGTSFAMYFPKSIKTYVTNQNQAPQTPTPLNGNETILLVEDENEIRTLAKDMLSEAGYKVVEAADASQAIQIIQSGNNQIDLLFTDISMPGEMNGVQLAARVQVLNPGVKLLFTTGYAPENIPEMSLIEKYPLINKPYEKTILLEKIRHAIELAA